MIQVAQKESVVVQLFRLPMNRRHDYSNHTPKYTRNLPEEPIVMPFKLLPAKPSFKSLANIETWCF